MVHYEGNTCNLNAQRFTRLVEVVAMSSDHASDGSLVASATRINKLLFYSQGNTLDVLTKTTP